MLSLDEFQNLKHNPAAQARVAVAREMHSYLEQSAAVEEHYALATDIARYLQRDPKLEVRATLAKSLQSSQHAPKAVIILLATDDEDQVALPVLQYSPLLDENDLILIIQKTDRLNRLLAISSREQLPAMVCEELFETRKLEVAVQLVKNEGAHVESKLIASIHDYFGYQPLLWQQLSQRSDHKILEVQRYYEQALRAANDDAERREADKRPSSEGVAAADIVRQYTHLKELGLAAPHIYEQAVIEYNRHGQLNPALMLLALSLGMRKFFSACLAFQMKMPVGSVDLVYGLEGKKFRQLYIRSHLSTALLPLFQHMLEACNQMMARGVKPATKEFEAGMLQVWKHAADSQVNFARTVGKPIINVLESSSDESAR